MRARANSKDEATPIFKQSPRGIDTYGSDEEEDGMLIKH